MKHKIGPIRAAILEWMGVSPEITNLSATQVAQLIGLGNSSSGQRVTVDSALQLSTVWACVRFLSETVSTLPVRIYRTQKDGTRIIDKTHPLHWLLTQSPHAEYTSSRFFLIMVASICMRGNSYTEKIFVGSKLSALEPLLPQTVKPQRNKITGALEYLVTKDGKQRIIPEDRMIHIRGFGVDDVVGLSPILQGRETMGNAMAAEQSAGKFFKKGMQLSGVLTTDTLLKPEQRQVLGDSMNAYASSENAGKLMVLEAGMKYQNISLNPEASQLLETRSFSVEEICRWFRVAPYMIGHMDKASSWASSAEAQDMNTLKYTFRPLLVNIEQQLMKDLLKPAERDIIKIEFAVEGLLRADSKSRGEYYNSALNNGWMSRNEVRRLENLPPIEGGDIYTVQAALIGVDKVGQNYGIANEQK